jgi:hypothetical protein
VNTIQVTHSDGNPGATKIRKPPKEIDGNPEEESAVVS